jgi:hypothetical protein
MSEEKFDYVGFYKKFYEAWEKTMSEGIDMWAKSPFFNASATETASGNKTTDFDPVDYYKKFYDVWEKTMSEGLEVWLKSPFFAATMGKTIEKSSEFKKYIDEIMDRSLKNMHFPTKGDIDRVLTSINNIEAKINDLGDKVDELKPLPKAPLKKSASD